MKWQVFLPLLILISKIPQWQNHFVKQWEWWLFLQQNLNLWFCSGCLENSLAGQVFLWQKVPEDTYIATAPMPWIDNYIGDIFSRLFFYLFVYLFVCQSVFWPLDLITWWPLGWATAEVTDSVKCCRQYTDTQEFCPSTVQVHTVHIYSTQIHRSSVLVQSRYIQYIYTVHRYTKVLSSIHYWSTMSSLPHVISFDIAVHIWSTQIHRSSVPEQLRYIKYIYSTQIHRSSVPVQFPYIKYIYAVHRYTGVLSQYSSRTYSKHFFRMWGD